MLNISRIGLAALAVLFTAQACFAHAVGERIECSPLGLPNSYFPGTIIEDNGGGAYTVKLDPRPGRSEEIYTVAAKNLRPIAAATGNAGQANNGNAGAAAGTGNNGAFGAANAMAATGNAPVGANQPAGNGTFVPGQRVMANSIFVPGDEHYKAGTIVGQPAPGMFEVMFDHLGRKLAVKQEWIRPGGPARAATPANPPAQAMHDAGRAPDAGLGFPPGGIYDCNMLSGGMLIHIGKLEIRGNTYRGFSAAGPFHTLGANGNNLVLSGGLSGMPDGFKLTSCSYVGKDSVGRPLIKIRYIGQSNAHDVIDAVLQ